MTINEKRFKAIMEGTASNLTAEEILVRNVAYQAERKGEDPLGSVQRELPHVQIIKDEVALGKSRSVSEKIKKKTDTKNKLEQVRTELKPYAALTKSQKQFIEEQMIPYSRVLDAAGLKMAEYKRAMQEGDYIVAVNVTPCKKYGHRIRSRHGHCVQCNISVLEFQDRKYRDGFVYVCYSAMNNFAKIGMTYTPERRLNVLKKQKYASVQDWEMIFAEKCLNAGLVEYKAQKLIEQFRMERTYTKDGRIQSCYEIFHCSAKEAIEAVKTAIRLNE
jgi:hypothetical protein